MSPAIRRQRIGQVLPPCGRMCRCNYFFLFFPESAQAPSCEQTVGVRLHCQRLTHVLVVLISEKFRSEYFHWVLQFSRVPAHTELSVSVQWELFSACTAQLCLF